MRKNETAMALLLGACAIAVFIVATIINAIATAISALAIPIVILVSTSIIGVIVFEVYCYSYFRGDGFLKLKESLGRHIEDCNELNSHIESLKSNSFEIESKNFGDGDLSDNSAYNYKRKEWSKLTRSNRIHNCTTSVLNGAKNQPLKYLCKYFGIESTEDSLSRIESMLNDFAAAEQGKLLLLNERDTILSSVHDSIPALIRKLKSRRLIEELGFNAIDLSDLYFPKYTFQYISAGGNSSARFDIRLDLQGLEELVQYLGDLVKFRKSAIGQRALMTTRLREQIKIRDNFVCQSCRLSTRDEPNLLLEIDHKIPIAKGGITTPENLQTLCWKCNRKKGAKIFVY